MATDQTTTTTPAAAQALVQMHQLLWQASVEAHQRAREARDLDSVDLAFNLSYLCDQVFHLVPEASRAALVEPPEATGADPIELLRRAEELTRAEPVHHFPAGITSVVGLLIDTLRDFS